MLNKVDKDYFDYIVYDEAHKIDTIYKELIDYFTPKFSLGMTATHERTKDSGYLFKVFEYSVPYEIRLIDSLANKLICPFTYYGFDSTVYEDDINNDIKDYGEFVYAINEKIKKSWSLW